MALPKLIMCVNHERFHRSARKYGWLAGSQMPAKIEFPLYFVDQDYKRPNRERYMAALERYRPTIATVLDLEFEKQYDEVLSWAYEAAQWVERVILIPKISGIIPSLPRSIRGKDVILGFSIPTSYGGTNVPLWEFSDWPIHLLGGSPHKQMAYYCAFHNLPYPKWFPRYLKKFVDSWRGLGVSAQVFSADSNQAMKMANGWASFWQVDRIANKITWVKLREIGLGDLKDAHFRAFDVSAHNIMDAWQRLLVDIRS